MSRPLPFSFARVVVVFDVRVREPFASEPFRRPVSASAWCQTSWVSWKKSFLNVKSDTRFDVCGRRSVSDAVKRPVEQIADRRELQRNGAVSAVRTATDSTTQRRQGKSCSIILVAGKTGSVPGITRRVWGGGVHEFELNYEFYETAA